MAIPTSHHHRSRSGWANPERTMVWTEPPKHKHNKHEQMKQLVVAVVYYLCRQDGQLDHPHFVHVPCLSDPPRLHLRDVLSRLSDLRGAAMPAAYSWSAKRTYRNAGYVWHDLTADDLILPAQPHPNDEYVLKGSPLLHRQPQLPPPATRASCRKQQNKHNRWASFDLADYQRTNGGGAPAAELIGIDGISPPPSSSGPDDNTLTLQQEEEDGTPQAAGLIGGGGRMRASAMLMQLISCGSIKDHAGQGQQRRLPPRRVRSDAHCNNNKADDQRDYFSGSLVETNSNRTSAGAIELRRSSSYNADRGASSTLALGEVDGVARKQQPPHGKSTAPRRKIMETHHRGGGVSKIGSCRLIE